MLFLFWASFIAHGYGQVAGEGNAGRGRILLVLPFDNKTGQPNLEWIREAAPELFTARFTSAGFVPLSRADRLYALDHLGLPAGFQPSRASSIKLAQTMDVDAIVVGSYSTDGTNILAEAQIVDVPHLRMREAVTQRGDIRNLIAVFDSLAWKLTRQLDPAFTGSEEAFVAAGANLRLEAFEQYIRGITEPDQAERLRHLQQAVKLSPDFSTAWMALGREYYAGQQYDQAAGGFSKVAATGGADTLEANFYRGLAEMFVGSYAKAELAFAAVARVLPLAPVLNNQAVAMSRQGHNGVALFRQAVSSDPASADFHFNLAVSLKRTGDAAGALNELGQYLKLRPNDSEAQQVESAWKQPGAGINVEPLERIERGFDAVAFRQAAVMLDEMESSRLAALSPQQRAHTLAGQAREYLSRGLMLEAERQYTAAVAADARSAEAHEGLAEVRERTGDTAGARNEANAAVQVNPSEGAYLVLARLDLAGNRLDDADKNANEALRLNPGNLAAKDILRQVTERKGQTKP